MDKILFILIVVYNSLLGEDNENKIKNVNLLYAPFIVIQEDSFNKQIKLSFIESKYVKSDGSYCDVDDENIPEIKDTNNFSEKYCKESLSTEKIIQTIKNENKAYPFDWETSPEKIVTLSKNYTDEEYDFYHSKGYTITNPPINSEHILKMENNNIKMQISGKAQSSRGMCSSETSVIITLKINNNLVFDNLHTNSYCHNLMGLNNITLDFKNNILRLDLYSVNYHTSEYFFDIPFSYFENKKNKLKMLNESELQRLNEFPNNMFVK